MPIIKKRPISQQLVKAVARASGLRGPALTLFCKVDGKDCQSPCPIEWSVFEHCNKSFPRVRTGTREETKDETLSSMRQAFLLSPPSLRPKAILLKALPAKISRRLATSSFPP